MKFKRLFPFLWMLFVAVLLAATTVAGLFDILDNFPFVDTPLRKLTLAFQVLYTLSGAIAVAGIFARRPWQTRAMVTWAVTVTVTATVAPPAWGGTGIGPALAGGAATGFVTGMIVWWTHHILRGFAATSRPQAGA
jgi:hypothetical protein